MTTLLYLIVYDVPATKAGNKRRQRLHNLLSGFGSRKQYSVFECFLTAIQFAKLQPRIEGLIVPAEDSLCIYIIDAAAVRKTITYGTEKPRQENTLIL
ncbi:CRISPR-associated endonuclease Cas2 [Spirulina sp. 06S082]|uniref:CRISPR-associated endonuclease Cas2 n=1 Tax=Spirulina sp. 06S082 TaxID=3110248 RepID=UPI002B20C315|nr:CRISPR-associated endonuclease Cas2 [Spirulina sp. 06S082]MEA5471424.1 CRISPR-associated endonuclease Cas2 [Spirulina sp. 06S082]